MVYGDLKSYNDVGSKPATKAVKTTDAVLFLEKVTGVHIV